MMNYKISGWLKGGQVEIAWLKEFCCHEAIVEMSNIGETNLIHKLIQLVGLFWAERDVLQFLLLKLILSFCWRDWAILKGKPKARVISINNQWKDPNDISSLQLRVNPVINQERSVQLRRSPWKYAVWMSRLPTWNIHLLQETIVNCEVRIFGKFLQFNT